MQGLTNRPTSAQTPFTKNTPLKSVCCIQSDYQRNKLNCVFRLDENSKLIVVDGAHAVGKSQFAKELAEELDMKYIAYPRMDDVLINSYGVDMRQYDEYMLPVLKVNT